MVARALDPETYASIVARIGEGEDRATVLDAHGYDEETFEEAESAFDAELSEAMLAEGGDAAPPPSLVALDAAFRGTPKKEGEVLSIERYAQAMSILESGERIEHRLGRAGITLAQVFAATAHHAPRLAREPELAAAFQRHKKRVRDDEGRGSSGG